MDAIVELKTLSKIYQRTRSGAPVVAVDGLSLNLGLPGTVHGFLGPNGSGKTTTIRCSLGLIRPTEGSVSVFGADATTEFYKVANRVGAIVESPKMFPQFTGRKNLSLLADLGGIAHTEVDRVLEVIGLSDRSGDTFASYSLGMKQRLAIGAALLKNPDLLILDEPANGLDPAGIAEMRALIRSIASQGKAVLVSSHQLAEIEQICDEITIISRGKLIVSGSLESVRANYTGSHGVYVIVEDPDRAMATLARSGLPAKPTAHPKEIFVETEPSQASEINRLLADSGQYLSALRSYSPTLEDVFLQLTAPPPPMAAAAAPEPPVQNQELSR